MSDNQQLTSFAEQFISDAVMLALVVRDPEGSFARAYADDQKQQIESAVRDAKETLDNMIRCAEMPIPDDLDEETKLQAIEYKARFESEVLGLIQGHVSAR